MNLYFIRHGESEGNSRQFHQGENVSLSEIGVKQARAVAQYFKQIKIDKLYTSPHLRAKHTAEIISEVLKLPLEHIEFLKELKRPTELEGLEYNHPKAHEIKKIIKENQTSPDWKYTDDESFNDLLCRAKQVEQHVLLHQNNENIVCISHIQITVLIVLRLLLQDQLTPSVFWQFFYHCKVNNTGIIHLEYSESSGWNLITWNNTTHLLNLVN